LGTPAAATAPLPTPLEGGFVLQFIECETCGFKNDGGASECGGCGLPAEEMVSDLTGAPAAARASSTPTLTDSDITEAFDSIRRGRTAVVDPTESCPFCLSKMSLATLIEHTPGCDGNPALRARFGCFLPPVEEMAALRDESIPAVAQRAVDLVIDRSRSASETALPALKRRCEGLGYSEGHLMRTLRYVRDEAPIIIHANLDKLLPHLIKDPTYRNQFETGTSGGSRDLTARKSWEDRMFHKIYQTARPDERVKYGVLNIVGDIKGVKACYHYGDSFLSLRRVRLRTTFASMDSSSPATLLASCEYHAHVLAQYSDAELGAVIEVATGQVPFHDSRRVTSYKEVQIHGPIRLEDHVEAIVANHRHAADTTFAARLQSFTEACGINLIWMDASD